LEKEIKIKLCLHIFCHKLAVYILMQGVLIPITSKRLGHFHTKMRKFKYKNKKFVHVFSLQIYQLLFQLLE
jgi:hypothetical protein